MDLKTTSGKLVSGNRNFTLFLLGQGVSNFGDAFQFIAATSLLVQITGSGLSAAFGLICYPVLSILLSPLAGHASDTRNEKAMLIAIDLLRGFEAILFIAVHNIFKIYALIIILSIFDIIYSPPKRKFLAGILKNEDLMTGNSLLNGLSGGVYIAGPILAGIIISNWGTNIAFFINSMSFIVSACCIAITEYKARKSTVPGKKKATARNTIESLSEGARYCLNTYMLRKIILIGTFICFATTSVNMAFYPFAFDVLKASDKTWGIMMSVFYGANLIAMSISLSVNFRLKTYYKIIVPISLVIISLIWFSYGKASKIGMILLLQLIEGTVLSYLSIVFTSHIQIKSNKDILGRVIGINDFVNNLGKIVGIACTYAILRISKPNAVFFLCAAVIFVYAFYTLAAFKSKHLETA